MSRVYKVTIAGADHPKLIRADTRAQAERWAARGMVSAVVASQDDLIDLAPLVAVEYARDPETIDAFA